jgi:ubiquinone/menaquinone biosynthesis C-methylase UbiE
MKPEEFARLYELEETFWWFEGMRRITAALLDPVCPAGVDRTVLDAGCGTGWNLRWLRRYSGDGRGVGIDVEPVAVELARERHGDDVLEASVLDLPFADASFDLVTSFDVLPQVPGEGGDETALREMRRVLRPGGVLFVRAAAYEWLRSGHDEALATHRRYRLGTLAQYVARAGLEVERATYANTFLFPLAVFHRLVLKRVGVAAPGSDVRPLPAGLKRFEGALTAALALEARFLRRRRATFPFGLSVVCVARRPT